jgi:hypothetical protein
MTGQQKTAMVAIGTVIFSLVSIILLLALTGGEKIAPRGIRFILTCVFAFFLWRGASWSRWLVGILALLGVITSIIGFFGLSAAGASVFSILGIWMVAMLPFHAWVSYMLLLDKDVASHFNPTSGY